MLGLHIAHSLSVSDEKEVSLLVIMATLFTHSILNLLLLLLFATKVNPRSLCLQHKYTAPSGQLSASFFLGGDRRK